MAALSTSHAASAVSSSAVRRRRERVVVRARAAAHRGDGGQHAEEPTTPAPRPTTTSLGRRAAIAAGLAAAATAPQAAQAAVKLTPEVGAVQVVNPADPQLEKAPGSKPLLSQMQLVYRYTSGLDPNRRFFHITPPLWEPYFGWGERVTVRRELVPGAIWGLEQEQALDVLAMNIRTTVGLWTS
jgi:hypothetical protein